MSVNMLSTPHDFSRTIELSDDTTLPITEHARRNAAEVFFLIHKQHLNAALCVFNV